MSRRPNIKRRPQLWLSLDVVGKADRLEIEAGALRDGDSDAVVKLRNLYQLFPDARRCAAKLLAVHVLSGRSVQVVGKVEVVRGGGIPLRTCADQDEVVTVGLEPAST